MYPLTSIQRSITRTPDIGSLDGCTIAVSVVARDAHGLVIVALVFDVCYDEAGGIIICWVESLYFSVPREIEIEKGRGRHTISPSTSLVMAPSSSTSDSSNRVIGISANVLSGTQPSHAYDEEPCTSLSGLNFQPVVGDLQSGVSLKRITPGVPTVPSERKVLVPPY